MSRRENLSQSESAGLYKTGLGTHIKNLTPPPSRGGRRL